MEPLPRPAIDALITENLDLVRIIARQVGRELGLSHRHDELESAGREGLVGAAKRFDPDRGVPFRRFANYRVRGAMIDALRRESTLPRRAYERLRALSGALAVNDSASEDLAAPAAPGTTASDLDTRLANHLANLATAIATGLVAQAAFEDDQITALDPALSPEAQASRSQLRTLVATALASLPDQERVLVQRHYFEGDRFDEVAKELGLSKSWASRLHTRAVTRLTKWLREQG